MQLQNAHTLRIVSQGEYLKSNIKSFMILLCLGNFSILYFTNIPFFTRYSIKQSHLVVCFFVYGTIYHFALTTLIASSTGRIINSIRFNFLNGLRLVSAIIALPTHFGSLFKNLCNRLFSTCACSRALSASVCGKIRSAILFFMCELILIFHIKTPNYFVSKVSLIFCSPYEIFHMEM